MSKDVSLPQRRTRMALMRWLVLPDWAKQEFGTRIEALPDDALNPDAIDALLDEIARKVARQNTGGRA